MKKHFSSAKLLFVCVFLFLVLGISVHAEVSGDYTYTVMDDCAIITGVPTSITGDIEVPDTLGGYPVTSIGYMAFADCRNLESVILPETVVYISVSAFYNCTSLTSISIPDSVNYIDSCAFERCTSLKNISLPKNITRIYSFTFNGCESLESVTIPESVESIEEFAFYGCESLTNITIPKNVSNIARCAFYGCASLESIVIPEKVTYIYSSVFEKCTNLTSITLPDTITSIDVTAFSSTGYYNDASNWEDGVLYIGNYLIAVSSDISGAYTIKQGTKLITDSAFEGCRNLTSITFPSSITHIEKSMFKDCTKLTSVTIPDSVTSIDGYVFEGCTSLTSITIPDSVTSINSSLFAGCTNLVSVKLPNGLRSIPASTFRDCKNLENVTIPSGVVSIGTRAFESCAKLKNITLPEGISSIPDSTFSSSGITSIKIPEKVTSIGYWAFYGCPLTSVTIPSSVKTINNGAFQYCMLLTEIIIPESVTSFGRDIFFYCPNVTIYGAEGSAAQEYATNNSIPFKVIAPVDISEYCTYYISGDDAIIERVSTDISGVAKVPATLGGYPVTTIQYGAFMDCKNLTGIIIPDSVVNIAVNAFKNCVNLETITLPDNIISINEDAFYNTAYYNDASNWEDGVLYIGNYLIEASPSLSGTYNIKQGTKTIARYAFSGCTGVTNITIPDSVLSISENAFYNTGYYNDASNWEDGVLYIGDYLIKASSLSGTYAIKQGTKKIASCAFASCSRLTGITIPSSVTHINMSAFKDCIKLESITIPEGVISIGGAAFNYCIGLENVIISNGVTCIDSSLFYDCSSLKNVVLPDSITHIKDCAFMGCRNLTSITIPNKVTFIGSRAFANTGLTSVTIPENVTSIGNNAFSNCPNLTIYGAEGSAAQEYATNNSIPFQAITFTRDELTVAANVVDGNIVLTISSDVPTTSKFMPAALYDEYDNVLDVIVIPTTADDTDKVPFFKDHPDASYVKVFLWNTCGDLSPVTNAARADIERA